MRALLADWPADQKNEQMAKTLAARLHQLTVHEVRNARSVMVGCIDQPTMQRLRRSTATATNNLPSPVQIWMKSAAYFRFGPSAAKSRGRPLETMLCSGLALSVSLRPGS